MQPTHNINPGDLVIAKMKGWPYWPAKVLNVQETARATRYEVQFFCTFQTAVVYPGFVLNYNEETKKKICYTGNRKDVRKYLEIAIEQIEKDFCMPPPTKKSRSSLSESDALDSSSLLEEFKNLNLKVSTERGCGSMAEAVAQSSGSSTQNGIKGKTALWTDDQGSGTADSRPTDEEDEDEESRLINQFCDEHNVQPKWEGEDELEAFRKKLASTSPLDFFNHMQANGMVKPLPFELKCEKGTAFYEVNKLVMDKEYGIDLDEWLAIHLPPKQGGTGTAPGGETGPAPGR